MPVEARISSDSPRKSGLDRSLAQSAAAEHGLGVNFAADPLFERQPQYHVYLFNISRRSFQVNQPLFKRQTIPACPAEKAYVMVGTLPDIIIQKDTSAETGQIAVHSFRGELVAMDIVCPSLMSFDQDAELSEESVSFGAGTTDLRKRGVFWSRNDIPTADELAKAKNRMEKFYRQLIQMAETKARAGKLLDITEEEHVAADYFGLKATWHQVAAAPSLCPNCGEEVKSGVAFHHGTFGICIIDQERAEKALPELKKAGKEK